MISDAFDPELLRTFVSVCRHGSLSRAADHAGRAQSALSTQMRRLERLIGKPLLRRTGRGVVATTEGELFLAYAVRILSLTEEAAARIGERVLAGTVRIGLAEDVAVTALPAALGRLRRSFPDLHLDVVVDNSIALANFWREGALDIAIATCSAFAADPLQIWKVDLYWVCGIDEHPDAAFPLDVVVYAEPCLWRRLMFQALSDAGRSFRVTLTSHNSSAIGAAVENGLGVALLTPECIRPEAMRIISPSPEMPSKLAVQYGLYAAPRQSPLVAAVIDVLRQSIHGPTFASTW